MSRPRFLPSPRFWAAAYSLTSSRPSSLLVWPVCPSPALVLDSASCHSASQLCNTTVQCTWPGPPQHPHYITSSWQHHLLLIQDPRSPPPRWPQPNAHLHDRAKLDPGSRSAVKSENPRAPWQLSLSPAFRAAGSQAEATGHTGTTKATQNCEMPGV